VIPSTLAGVLMASALIAAERLRTEVDPPPPSLRRASAGLRTGATAPRTSRTSFQSFGLEPERTQQGAEEAQHGIVDDDQGKQRKADAQRRNRS
jgi:hypothetical protein